MAEIAKTSEIRDTDFYIKSDIKIILASQLNDIKKGCLYHKTAYIKKARFYKRVHYVTGFSITFFSLFSILFTFLLEDKIVFVLINSIIVVLTSIITFFRPESKFTESREFISSINSLVLMIDYDLNSIKYRGTDSIKEEIGKIVEEYGKLLSGLDVLDEKNYMEEKENDK
jgi:hypothetical protein